MLRVLVCVSGGGTNLQALIDGIAEGSIRNASIVRVISSSPGAYGLERAKNAGIEGICVNPKDYPAGDNGIRPAFDEAFLQAIDEASPDLVVLAGFLTKVPSIVTKKYKNRIINIHPSLIPAFCGKGFYGLKVHEKALERGVKITGATVHYVDDGMDTGPIILQKAVEVLEGDTPELLQKRVMEQAEWEILPKAVDMIANG